MEGVHDYLLFLCSQTHFYNFCKGTISTQNNLLFSIYFRTEMEGKEKESEGKLHVVPDVGSGNPSTKKV